MIPDSRAAARGVLALVMAWALAGCGSGETAQDGPRNPGEGGGMFRALSYNVAGLPQIISDEEPATNAPLISPLLNDYDLVLLQESWADPVQQLLEMGLLPFDYPGILGYHHLIVAEARHPYRSEPAPHPLGTDLRRGLDGVLGPTLFSDGLNRLSWFPFGHLERVMWRACHGSLLMTPIDALFSLPGLEALAEALGLIGNQGPIDDGAGDCGAQKGFSVASHEIAPGVWVDVYNHHADASGHDRDLEAKADNFEQLADYILAHSEGRAVILGGDTNLRFDRSRRAHQQLMDGGTWARFQQATGLTDVCAAIDCGDLDAMAADEGFSIHDRFAFRSGGGIELRPVSHAFEREKFTRDDGEPLSDHDPVAVTFEWWPVP